LIYRAARVSKRSSEEFAMWGGPPGPQSTPASTSVLSALESQGSGADEGVLWTVGMVLGVASGSKFVSR